MRINTIAVTLAATIALLQLLMWTGGAAQAEPAPAPAMLNETAPVTASFARTATNNGPTAAVIPGFDTALGALVEVKIRYKARGWASAGIEDTSAPPSYRWCSLSSSLRLSLQTGAGDIIQNHGVVVAALAEVDSPGFDGTIDFAGPSGASKTNWVDSPDDWASYTDPTILAALTGATVTLQQDELPYTAASASNGGATFTLLERAGRADVIYVYQ